MTTSQQSSIEKFNNTLADAEATVFQPKIVSKENNMSTTDKVDIEALRQAVQLYPSLTAICNDIQDHRNELHSLRIENINLREHKKALLKDSLRHFSHIKHLETTIFAMKCLCAATFGCASIGYFLPAALGTIAKAILLFYCGATLAITMPKVRKSYSMLLAKLETLLSR